MRKKRITRDKLLKIKDLKSGLEAILVCCLQFSILCGSWMRCRHDSSSRATGPVSRHGTMMEGRGIWSWKGKIWMPSIEPVPQLLLAPSFSHLVRKNWTFKSSSQCHYQVLTPKEGQSPSDCGLPYKNTSPVWHLECPLNQPTELHG